MFSALAFITWCQWRKHKLRVTLTSLGIALGVTVFFAVLTANTALLSSLRLTVEKLAGKATLQVTAGESGLPEETLKIVRSTPGVVLAEPVIEVIVRTAFSDEDKLLVLGLDAGSDQELHEFQFDQEQVEIANPLAFLMRSDSILVSRTFAQKHGLRDGDRLPLYTPDGLKNFTVRGFFKPIGIGETFGGQVAVMDVYAAQRAFDRGKNFDRIDLLNDAKMSVEELQRRLRERLSAGIEILRPESRGQGIENSIAAMEIGLTITSFLALFIGVFIIFNSFSISVNQRWKEIGILRAIGVERVNVRRMFLGEAALIGLIGSLVGVLAGFLLAAQASSVMSNVAATLYGHLTTAQRPSIRLDYAAAAVGIGVVASLIAAWLPAQAASRLDPVLALHNVEVQHESALGWPRIFIGMILVVVGLALIRFFTPQVGLKLQLAYSLLIQLGMIMILPKLTEWGARALRPVMARVFGAEGMLAIDTMIKSPRRTYATVGALMVGLSFVFANGAFIKSQKNALTRYMDRVLNADMLVTTSEELRSRSYHFSETMATRLAAIPGVVRTESFRFTAVPFRGDNVGLIANDMEAWFGRVSDILDEGDEAKARELMPRGEGLLIANNFAARWGVSVGDNLRIETPTGSLERPVLGIFENYDSEKGTIFLDRQLYKTYWKDNAVDYVFLNLAPGADPEVVRNQIQRGVAGEQRAFVYTNLEYKRWVINLIDHFFTLTYAQMIVAILVAALGIMNTLIISVSERQREIGIIRAIGGQRRQLRKMILLEALAMAIIGVAAGALSGLFNAYFLVRTAAIMIAGFSLHLQFPTALVLLTLPLVVTVALAAALWPAHWAMRLGVIEAIGYE